VRVSFELGPERRCETALAEEPLANAISAIGVSLSVFIVSIGAALPFFRRSPYTNTNSG
jgi:hypothetical protein